MIKNIMNRYKTPDDYIVSDKELFNLIIPIFIGFILDYIAIFIDSVMVSSIGESALAGVALIDQFTYFLVLFFSAFSSGGGIVLGQYLGHNERKKAQNISTQIIWFTTILAIVLMIILLILRPFIIAGLFGQIEADVWSNANQYYQIVILMLPFLAIYYIGTGIFRITNRASLPIKIMVGANLLNIAGNVFFIYYIHWGVVGVAISTVASEAFAAALTLYKLLDEKQELHIKKSLRYKFEYDHLKDVLKVGLPFGIENGSFHFGRLLIASLVSTFGTAAIAANSIGNTVGTFSVMAGLSINIALTIVISKCVGANDYKQVKYYTKKCAILVIISHTVINAIIFILLPVILSGYNVNPETIDLASKMIIWHGIFSIIIWPLSFSLPSMLRGAGDTRTVMYISMSVMFIFRIAFAYILASWLGFGVFGTWIAMFVDWYVRAALYVYRYLSKKWMKSSIV